MDKNSDEAYFNRMILIVPDWSGILRFTSVIF